MALNTVTLRWNITDLAQSGQAGVLTITPTAQMADATDHELIAGGRTVNFTGGTGQLAGIVANDNSAVLPAGTGYLITVVSAAGQVIVPQFQTQLLFANGATQWLDQLAPVPSVTTSYQYLPLPTGTPAAGEAPVATGAGEASAWGTVLATTVVALTDGPTIAVNASAGNLFRVTLGANRTLASPAGGFDGQLIRVEVTQDGTGGRTLAYGGAYDFGTAGAPVLSTAPGVVDVLGFSYKQGAGKWQCLAFAGGY